MVETEELSAEALIGHGEQDEQRGETGVDIPPRDQPACRVLVCQAFVRFCVPLEIDVLAGQRYDHQLGAAQGHHLSRVFGRGRALGLNRIGKDLPQRRALLGTVQHEEGIPLAESGRRRPFGCLQQPVRGARRERLAGELAEHPAALDDLGEFHAASVDSANRELPSVSDLHEHGVSA